MPFAPFHTSTSLGMASAEGPAALARRNPNKADYTHFIAIPIGTLPEVRGQLETLLECMKDVCVANNDNDNNNNAGNTTAITPELFNTVDRMHLTLLLLSLHTAEHIQLARELLMAVGEAWQAEKRKLLQPGSPVEKRFRVVQDSDSSATAPSPSPPTPQDPKPLLRLGGLHVMPPRHLQERNRKLLINNNNTNRLPYADLTNGVDASHAAVVFMGLHDVPSLLMVQSIHRVVRRVFSELLMSLGDEDSQDNLELCHMTILNKKWSRNAAKRPFDATGLLSIFGESCLSGGEEGSMGEEETGCFPIRELVLCRMSSSSRGGRSRSGGGGGVGKESYVREAVVSL